MADAKIYRGAVDKFKRAPVGQKTRSIAHAISSLEPRLASLGRSFPSQAGRQPQAFNARRAAGAMVFLLLLPRTAGRVELDRAGTLSSPERLSRPRVLSMDASPPGDPPERSYTAAASLPLARRRPVVLIRLGWTRRRLAARSISPTDPGVAPSFRPARLGRPAPRDYPTLSVPIHVKGQTAREGSTGPHPPVWSGKERLKKDVGQAERRTVS